MIGGAKGIGLGIDLGLVNQYNRTGSQSYIEPEVLDSLVGVWSAYGMTNDSPNRSTIKNKLSNKGGDFVISNAAFKLNSGFGKYEVDFSTLGVGGTGLVYERETEGLTIINSLDTQTSGFSNIQSIKTALASFKIRIEGLKEGERVRYHYNKNTDDTARTKIDYTSDGIYELPTSVAGNYSASIAFGYILLGNSKITITQIPSFEGAFVTDGIDDLITSTKTVQEMLGGSNEITVVSMIHQIDGNIKYTNGYTNYIRHGGGFIRNTVSGINGKGFNKTGIYGYTSTQLDSSNMGLGNVINNILGDKDDYSFERSSTYTLDDAKYSVQNFVNANNQPSNEGSSIAWYWTIIANKVLTTDQINQVIAYFNLDRTLKSDIYCNIAKQGITNENHTEFGDKLIDFSGNGRDIQLNNLAWDGDSGIGKYNYPNWKVTATIANTYSTIVNYPTVNGTYSINVNGVSELMQSIGLHLEIKYTTSTGIIYNDIKQDGVYSYILPDGATDLTLRFGGIPGIVNEPCNITITQIPSHAGALCLDGVNDFGQFVGDLELKDYTFIADRAYSRIAPSQVPFIASTQTNGQAPFLMEYLNEDTYVYPHSFGTTTKTTNLNIQRQISYQSTYVYNGNSISKGTSVDTGDGLTIGNSGSTGLQYSPLCLWSLMLFPYSMSEFLIERQLKKHKLGTLYPDMVEFRPVIKQDNRIKSIKYYIDGKTANIGQYYPIGTGLGIAVETVQPYMVKSLKVNGVNTIPNADYKVFNARLDSKSPQKITMDIQVNSSLVQWNPVVESNAEYKVVDCYIDTLPAVVGNYYPINSKLRIAVTTKGAADEVTSLTVNGVSLGTPSVDGNRFSFNGTLSDKSPQKINITIDEYIRYEDIVQPYPVLLRFNDENGNEVSWGGKFRVGSTITRIGSAADSNLLPNIYNIFGLLLNDNQVTSSKAIVEKTMVFKAKSAYIFDNNEPNCILSPRLLRIPNSSYKLLGYIPDISGHGNHGVIHNSAYGEGSGVNEDGSYQFDGVNDHVTIPTVTGGGKQVLMKVNNNTINSMLYDQRSSGASPNSLYSDFAIYSTNTVDNNLIAYQSRLVGKTYIDGILNTNITCEDLLGVLHNITITCDIVVPNNGVVPNIGRGGVLKDLYSKVALYDFMLFDEISTDDKIKELNEYVGIEAKVELPPYYWDAYGKTNLDEDKATIQQRGVAVGDYDLTNYNHAYDKMSGYGGYNLGRFDKSWSSSSSSNTSIKVVQRNPYDITLKKLGGNSDWEFNNTELKVISNPVSVKFKSNKNIRVTCDYHYYPVGGNSEGTPLGITSKDLIANKDAIITISPISQENIDKYNIDVNRGYYLIYFQLSSTLAVNEEVTIEMLPLYTNGLAYDGVTDYSENANIPALTDYTYIFKRDILGFNPRSVSMHKGTSTNAGRAFTSDYDYGETNEVLAYSFGSSIATPNATSKKIIYGTKTSVDGQPITPGSNIDDAGLFIGKWYDDFFKKMVFYKLILYPKTIPLLQINFLKNLMERDEIIDLNNPIFIQE